MTESKPMSTIEPKSVAQDTQLPTSSPPKRKRIDDEALDDNPAQFRRVRLRYWDQSHAPEFNLAHSQDASADIGIMLDEPNQTDLEYLDHLLKFHRQHSTDFINHLSNGNRPLALHELKKAVERYGGFKEVCKLNRWAEIGRDLERRGRITSSLSTSLKYFYQRWLLPYEEYLKIVEPGISPVTTVSIDTADDRPDLRTGQTSIQSWKRRRDSQPRSDSFNMPTFHPANLNPLSHPIGTSYMPNAQLMYSSDEESDVAEDELPDWNAQMSQSSQPVGTTAKHTDAFAFSIVNSNPSVHALGSNSVFNERSHAFATPSELRYESVVNDPRSDSSELQRIAASFETQGF